MPAAPKFRRRSDARPDEILDTALAVFGDKGFDAARMEDIARGAGVSKGAIYLYFESKEAVLKGLIEREVAPVAAQMRALAEAGAGDPAGTLSLIIATAAQFTEGPGFAATPRVVLSVAARFPEIGRYYREHVVDIGLGAIETLIAKGVAGGAFRNVDARAAARMVLGPILLKALHVHILGGAPDRDAAARAEALTDILFRGIAA
ncbi:MAG TPA: TetR family transcriptional regulator [Parvularcula sp.]|nr:TetR family transcriptional regulator [Parvularcula sp.]HBS32959.1 TetR family transcriptional regulator [Parvularcula sp.]HBS33787.1 TetR family transcriptional regulator [Parvularcula sp.]